MTSLHQIDELQHRHVESLREIIAQNMQRIGIWTEKGGAKGNVRDDVHTEGR